MKINKAVTVGKKLYVLTLRSSIAFCSGDAGSGKITVYQPFNLYRKFTAHNIFDGYQLLPSQSVLVTTGEGTVVDIIDGQDAGDNVEFFEGTLTPGFINTHCHTELSYLKGVIGTNTGLVAFVEQVMKSRGELNEMNIDAMQRAETEMYNSGIVAVGDICNTADTIQLKQQSKLQWHNFIEISGFSDTGANARLDAARNIYHQFATLLHQPVTLTPHAPYSVSKTLFKLLNSETAGKLITIHNQECAAEDELYFTKSGDFLNLYKNFGIDAESFQATGKSSLQSWLPLFEQQQSVLSVHNTFTSEADIDFYKSRNNQEMPIYFCLCANANQYIEQKIPPVELLRRKKCQLVIGTDSYASNWQLNLLEEMKTIQQKMEGNIPLWEILQWATTNGARALRMDDRLGSFEKGKKPGIVFISDLDKSRLTAKSTAQRIL